MKEYEAKHCIRLVAQGHGTIRDMVFVVLESGGTTALEMTMDASPYRFTPEVLRPRMANPTGAAIEEDTDAFQAYCEGTEGS